MSHQVTSGNKDLITLHTYVITLHIKKIPYL